MRNVHKNIGHFQILPASLWLPILSDLIPDTEEQEDVAPAQSPSPTGKPDDDRSDDDRDEILESIKKSDEYEDECGRDLGKALADDEVEFPDDYGKKQAKRGRPNLAGNLVGKTLRKFQKRQKGQSTTPLPGIPEEEKKDEEQVENLLDIL